MTTPDNVSHISRAGRRDLAGGGQPPHDGDMEKRIEALERLIPTLATSEQVREGNLALKSAIDALVQGQKDASRDLNDAELRLARGSKDQMADLHGKYRDEIATTRTWMLSTTLAIIGVLVIGAIGLGFTIWKTNSAPSAPAPSPAPVVIPIQVVPQLPPTDSQQMAGSHGAKKTGSASRTGQ